MARGDRVIAISDYVARYVLDNYKVDPSVMRVIPRGVDVDRFDPERVSAERVIRLAREWRLPDGVPVILAPARLTRWKGQTVRSEEHTSELQSLMRISYAVFCLKKKNTPHNYNKPR